MVAGRLFEEPGAVLDTTALGIVRAEGEPADTRERDRCSTHCAGFEGDVEVALGEPRRADAFRRGTNGKDLGMRGRVVQFLDPIAGGGENSAGCAIDDDRADRHLAAPGGSFRFGERRAHERIVAHPRTMSAAADRIKLWPD